MKKILSQNNDTSITISTVDYPKPKPLRKLRFKKYLLIQLFIQ